MLEPALEGLERALDAATDFDAVLMRYRVAAIRSALDLMGDLRADQSASVARPRAS